MSASADELQLAAGGLVPASATLDVGEAVDTVVARAYRHAVLPGRTVIRLTAENVAAGDDLEMATLGFGPGEDRGGVAKERKRPLGFPGWALVHDPRNARYALDVVKEFKKHARRAKSKPGHAKDGIDALAEQLGKTVPHFLPSFYEEAGRAFIEHGAASFAATMFSKAREAEAVHALEVDEQHRVVAFLEFALAGAVTTKALTQYAKELGDHHAPAAAYGHFRQLCVQRTLGGMPPWSGMAKELRRLAKAAKLDLAEEDRRFAAEVIQSPALGKAAGEFWRAYATPITELGQRSAAIRGAILDLFPKGPGVSSSADIDEAWLDLVESTGAVQALVSDDAPAEARPAAGRAGWFDKLTQHLARNWRDSKVGDRAFALLRRMAPMLVADGKPITCNARYSRIDLDLCELALELGVRVVPAAKHARIDLDAWAKRAHEPGHGCDPVRTAAHPALAPLLGEAVARELGDEPFDSMSRGKPGFLDAKRAWLAGLIDRAERGGLVGLGEAIATIRSKVKAQTFAELPELHARFAALDPARALARSLRIGLIDELGWPALEEAAAELDREGAATAEDALTIHGGPPAIVLASKTRAIAVGSQGRLGVHDLVIPPKHELVTARFIQGQFLVVLKLGYKVRGYWSGAPHDVFDSEGSAWSTFAFASRAAVLGDGAWIEGHKAVRAGDRVTPHEQGLVACDGLTSWVKTYKDGEHRWTEVSASGELGRVSWAAFIESGIEPGWKIDASASYVLPAHGLDASPLGLLGSLVGVRVRDKKSDGSTILERELERIDGVRYATTRAPWPTQLLTLPGTDVPRPVSEESKWRAGVTSTLIEPETGVRGSKIGPDERRYLRGQVKPLPPTLWHAMVARDEAGSRRLRSITEDDARALLATMPPIDDQIDDAVIGGLLPEVTHPRLRAGIVGFAMIAAQHGRELVTLAAERSPEAAAARASSHAGHDDDALGKALGGWNVRGGGARAGKAWTQLERTAAWFAAGDRDDRRKDGRSEDLGSSQLDWLGLTVTRSALAFLATAIGTPPERRRVLVDLFEMIAGTFPPAEQLRCFRVQGPLEADPLSVPFHVRWLEGNAYAIRRYGFSGHTYRVLEYAPDGTFRVPAGFAIDDEVRGRAGLTLDELPALTAAVDAGQTSWSDDGAARISVATGLTPSAAAFLLAGCPNAHDRSANFLPKELREQLGLKATQAALARDALNAIPLAKRIAAIDDAARGGVAALLDARGPDAIAHAWTQRVGVKVAVPEALLVDADRELHTPIAPSLALAMFAAAEDAPELTTDAAWIFDKQTAQIAKAQDAADDAFGPQVLHAAVSYLPFLYAELPVGDELRAKAVVSYELIGQRLASAELWFDAGSRYLTDEEQPQMARMVDGLDGALIPGLDEGIVARLVSGGAVVLSKSRLQLRIHPATLDPRTADVTVKLATLVSQYGHSAWKSLEYFRSPGLAQMMARIRDTPVPAGRWEQDPAASVPELVARAAKHLGTSAGAAALYLQYLTLLWPTPKNLQQWNGWRPKQLDAATAELVDKELILEAKRERAQRAHFLPGAWEALKSPHPPLETWKVPLYGVADAQGDPVPPLGRFLALAPFHAMFAAAWQRIEDGDVPRYEEIKR